MYKTILDVAATGAWTLSAVNTLTDFDIVSTTGVIQFALSILGVIWTVVRIVNEVKNGVINRENTRLNNERIELENQDLEEDFDAFSRNERHN